MRNSRTSGDEKWDWKVVVWFVVAMMALVGLLEFMVGRNDEVLVSGNKLCDMVMPELPSKFGIRSGWWVMKELVRQDDVILLRCVQENVTNIDVVE